MKKLKIGWCVCGAKTKKKHFPGCPRSKNKIVAPTQNVVTLVVDTSGSMVGLMGAARKALKQQVQDIASAAADNKMTTTLRVIEFDTRPRIMYTGPVNGYVPDYKYPNGPSTNIYEALVTASTSPNLSVPNLVILITDGQHNTGERTQAEMRNMIEKMQASGLWTISVIGPADTLTHMGNIGIPAGNLSVFDGSELSLEQNVRTLGASVKSYYVGTSSGTYTSTKNFIATVDTPAVVRKLPKVNGMKQGFVTQPTTVKDECIRLVGKFAKGAMYYELTKPELVQDYKTILIQDNKTGDVLGGNTRKALGLPGTGNTKVRPGDLQGFKVFVQSTSDNRKLVPGTAVIVKTATC